MNIPADRISTEEVRNVYIDRHGPGPEACDEFDDWLRRFKAETLRQAARDLSWFGAQGNTVEPNTAWAGVQACMNALNYKADEMEDQP